MSGPSKVSTSRVSSIGWLAAFALGTMCLWPGAAAAQTSGDSVMTAAEAQAAFATTGYQVDPIQNWSWTTPSVQSFEVHDPASQRVLMVVVFPTSGDASLLRGEMALHQESTTSNPYLLAGYGPSVWSGNIAMMESTQSAVDADFQEALSNAVANL